MADIQGQAEPSSDIGGAAKKNAENEIPPESAVIFLHVEAETLSCFRRQNFFQDRMDKKAIGKAEAGGAIVKKSRGETGEEKPDSCNGRMEDGKA